MNKSLIDNWNQCVEPEDQVFFLGDFGLGDVEHLHSICSQLKGHKICIRGNYDRNVSHIDPLWRFRLIFLVAIDQNDPPQQSLKTTHPLFNNSF